MPGLVPGIHVFLSTMSSQPGVDGRDKPGHDASAKTEMPRFRGASQHFNEGPWTYFTALRIAAARSVFSHEKPPSLSGARPK